jgi:Fe-S oxidoreductase
LRKEWLEALNVNSEPGDTEVEYLYWLGCASSFDFRSRIVAEAVIKLLQVAGISFAVLKEEKCCGDPARRTGNEYLFQVLARGNIKMIDSYGGKTIITSCPHCFNTLKNEYSQLGCKFEVLHHSQILNRLLNEKRLVPAKNNGAGVITFQDPCYLGRHNGIYREPRGILEYLPGTELVEMKRNRAKSFCCGAGGGRIWIEDSAKVRLNRVRAAEAVESGANKVITACPFCLLMLDDAIRAIKNEDAKFKVMDISEILLEAVQDR